ncbi:MAG TPA: SigB/SigF/SigG family RNA polymerase sigma factor [Baekduia sp.]|uniref:SigB/SigF/SigG family RNA polymerase sigma factor n=1 Tax=Baekduia sp. TaxID=2600305 RepID=UPI002D77FFE4|nr:SigB/SigF/SigG family RNA polymerase sigma factor [Baekduia sp.]HET6507601.1 SigB/SigF/SigG family RNA polymerase sigma factor [Baekduia sp.]
MDPTTATTAGGDDVRALLRRWHTQGDRAARDEVAARMLPLARSLARRYANKGEPLDDLEQVACVGLIKAIDRFDLSREVRFATYAVPTIAGELKRHFRDRGWMMRVPREIQELSGKIGAARERLVHDLARSPTVAELARATGADEERVMEALAAAEAYRTLSLDQPFQDGTGPLEAIGDDDHGFERAEARAMLADGLEELAPREREIVRLRYYEGLTQREIAEHIGISQMHVSRLIRRTVQQLRERITVPAAA